MRDVEDYGTGAEESPLRNGDIGPSIPGAPQSRSPRRRLPRRMSTCQVGSSLHIEKPVADNF